MSDSLMESVAVVAMPLHTPVQGTSAQADTFNTLPEITVQPEEAELLEDVHTTTDLIKVGSGAEELQHIEPQFEIQLEVTSFASSADYDGGGGNPGGGNNGGGDNGGGDNGGGDNGDGDPDDDPPDDDVTWATDDGIFLKGSGGNETDDPLELIDGADSALLPGQTFTYSFIGTAEDNDTKTVNDDPPQDVADSFTYEWSASAGTIDEETGEFTAPTTPQEVTITLKVIDDAEIPEGEGGDRDDTDEEVEFTVEIREPKLVEVDFKEFAVDQQFNITKDDGTAYSTVEWRDNSGSTDPEDYDGDATDPTDDLSPVGYIRNTPPVVSAKFYLGVDEEPQDIKVRGTAPDGMEFLVEKGSDDPNDPNDAIGYAGGYLTITDTASQSFKDEIDYFENFTINWEVSLDDGNTWIQAGSSDNQVYITLAKPTGSSLIHTVVHTATYGQDIQGKTDSIEVVDEIWDEFSDRIVNRVDGTLLTYNHDNGQECFDTAAMLADPQGRGRCGAWASFLVDVVAVHGISATTVKVTHDEAPPQGLINAAPQNGWILTGETGFAVNEVPAQGSGQQNYNVVSFADHVLVTIDGFASTIFDPSYGKKYDAATMAQAQLDWENANLDRIGWDVADDATGDALGLSLNPQPHNPLVKELDFH